MSNEKRTAGLELMLLFSEKEGFRGAEFWEKWLLFPEISSQLEIVVPLLTEIVEASNHTDSSFDKPMPPGPTDWQNKFKYGARVYDVGVETHSNN